MTKNVSIVTIACMTILTLVSGCGHNHVEGVVQYKSYTPSSVGVGTGVGTEPTTGQTSVITTTTISSDSYDIMVNGNDYEINKNDWLNVQVGDKVSFDSGTFSYSNFNVLER